MALSLFYYFIGIANRRLLAGQRHSLRSQLHRIFTSAHADGCAEQCFEGVQFGSIVRGGKGHGRQIASLLSGWIVIARSAKRGRGGSAAWLTLTRMYLSAVFCVHKPLSFSRCLRLLLARISHQIERLITDTRKQEKPIAAAWKGEHAAVYGRFRHRGVWLPTPQCTAHSASRRCLLRQHCRLPPLQSQRTAVKRVCYSALCPSSLTSNLNFNSFRELVRL